MPFRIPQDIEVCSNKKPTDEELFEYVRWLRRELSIAEAECEQREMDIDTAV